MNRYISVNIYIRLNKDWWQHFLAAWPPSLGPKAEGGRGVSQDHWARQGMLQGNVATNLSSFVYIYIYIYIYIFI